MKEDLEAKITREELRLAALEVEIAETTAHLAELRRQLTTEAVVQIAAPRKPVPPTAAAPATNAAKLTLFRLFRSLFRGREDVFPRRWENMKKGRSGYAPGRNEWGYGLCEKKRGLGASRRATCGECSYQAFIPVSNEEIAKHLRGDLVMGVYPLLHDETCWFVAADFDDKTWQEDAAAFAETCKLQGREMALERSRSGNGAQAWIFFASPVPAVGARKLGCFLITETMTRHHQLSIKSHDRLFSSQDTMPKGGFGNLIAIPLQRHARDPARVSTTAGSIHYFWLCRSRGQAHSYNTPAGCTACTPARLKSHLRLRRQRIADDDEDVRETPERLPRDRLCPRRGAARA